MCSQKFLLKIIPLLKENGTFYELYYLKFLKEFNSRELTKFYKKMYLSLRMDEEDFYDYQGMIVSPIFRCLNMCYFPKTIIEHPELIDELESILRKHEKWINLESKINSLITKPPP